MRKREIARKKVYNKIKSNKSSSATRDTRAKNKS
jgi:hypothetical protein